VNLKIRKKTTKTYCISTPGELEETPVSAPPPFISIFYRLPHTRPGKFRNKCTKTIGSVKKKTYLQELKSFVPPPKDIDNHLDSIPVHSAKQSTIGPSGRLFLPEENTIVLLSNILISTTSIDSNVVFHYYSNFHVHLLWAP